MGGWSKSVRSQFGRQSGRVQFRARCYDQTCGGPDRSPRETGAGGGRRRPRQDFAAGRDRASSVTTPERYTASARGFARRCGNITRRAFGRRRRTGGLHGAAAGRREWLDGNTRVGVRTRLFPGAARKMASTARASPPSWDTRDEEAGAGAFGAGGTDGAGRARSAGRARGGERRQSARPGPDWRSGRLSGALRGCADRDRRACARGGGDAAAYVQALSESADAARSGLWTPF